MKRFSRRGLSIVQASLHNLTLLFLGANEMRLEEKFNINNFFKKILDQIQQNRKQLTIMRTNLTADWLKRK